MDYLAVDELERRYRDAKGGIKRSHYQIIWFLAQGRSPADVPASTSYSRDRIYKLLRRYNEQGLSALGDQRRHNPGQAPLVNAVQQAQL
ncbi:MULTISPECIES: helix-turn-helix domain-containing protein [Cyanophyceae]|uniref:Helix-turn-helix domain-containing protein n=1 Tax=Leptolyngbya subtilissima DQ-A4 TaxID=2933933 RepID=A0ABV0K8S8_9CYAN|nr:helix-turn-helix domain-containing protein [Nodosilinea sp. FACHB-141]MBD2110343.1 helix-turn-helix domain-containing protein [Nodosilinea sp. FACHB-141]